MMTFCHIFFYVTEPGLLEDLARRVEEAEQLFQARDLDVTLRDLQAAKQRQVINYKR